MQKEGVKELADIVRIHVDNVSSRNVSCGYFSSRDDGNKKRCLAAEQIPEATIRECCRFYDSLRETKCGYKGNYETFKKEELGIKEIKRCGIDYPADVDIDSIRADRAAK